VTSVAWFNDKGRIYERFRCFRSHTPFPPAPANPDSVKGGLEVVVVDGGVEEAVINEVLHRLAHPRLGEAPVELLDNLVDVHPVIAGTQGTVEDAEHGGVGGVWRGVGGGGGGFGGGVVGGGGSSISSTHSGGGDSPARSHNGSLSREVGLYYKLNCNRPLA
jgi:hypothetical protein